MHCPSCQIDLQMAERHGVEIDYCPKCRGVWLDRGELDKIIERAADRADDRRQSNDHDSLRHDRPRYDGPRDDSPRHDRPRDGYRPGDHDHRHHKSRKRSFLGELFDFD